MSAACSILSLQRELVAEAEPEQRPSDPSNLPLSQERLIRKAASLSHFLINEVTVAPVSPTPPASYIIKTTCTLVSMVTCSLCVPQPCQTIYQVFHDAVTRLIQYGVLYVAEVSRQIVLLISCCVF